MAIDLSIVPDIRSDDSFRWYTNLSVPVWYQIRQLRTYIIPRQKTKTGLHNPFRTLSQMFLPHSATHLDHCTAAWSTTNVVFGSQALSRWESPRSLRKSASRSLSRQSQRSRRWKPIEETLDVNAKSKGTWRSKEGKSAGEWPPVKRGGRGQSRVWEEVSHPRSSLRCAWMGPSRAEPHEEWETNFFVIDLEQLVSKRTLAASSYARNKERRIQNNTKKERKGNNEGNLANNVTDRRPDVFFGSVEVLVLERYE